MSLKIKLNRLLIKYEQFQPFNRKSIVINNLIGFTLLPFIILWTKLLLIFAEGFYGGVLLSTITLFIYFLGVFIYAMILPSVLFYFERPILNIVSYLSYSIIFAYIIYFYRDFSMPIPFIIAVPFLMTNYYATLRYEHLTKIKKFFLY